MKHRYASLWLYGTVRDLLPRTTIRLQIVLTERFKIEAQHPAERAIWEEFEDGRF